MTRRATVFVVFLHFNKRWEADERDLGGKHFSNLWMPRLSRGPHYPSLASNYKSSRLSAAKDWGPGLFAIYAGRNGSLYVLDALPATYRKGRCCCCYGGRAGDVTKQENETEGNI